MYAFNTYSSIISYLHATEKDPIWGHGYATCNQMLISQRNKKINLRFQAETE